jgi:hypothetical protein
MTYSITRDEGGFGTEIMRSGLTDRIGAEQLFDALVAKGHPHGSIWRLYSHESIGDVRPVELRREYTDREARP